MKYKNQLFFCVFVFLSGYGCNFLLPVNVFANNFFGVQYLKNSDYSDENVKLNKHISYDLALINENKKNITRDSRMAPSRAIDSVVINKKNIEDSNRSPSDCDGVAALQGELSMLRDYRMQTEIEKHDEYLKSLGGNSFEALNDNFRREPVDAIWAKEKENLINNVIDQNKYLSQTPHLSSECKSKQCKVSVLSDDQFYLNNLSDSMGKVIGEQASSFSSYVAVVDEKSHITNIYFDRN